MPTRTSIPRRGAVPPPLGGGRRGCGTPASGPMVRSGGPAEPLGDLTTVLPLVLEHATEHATRRPRVCANCAHGTSLDRRHRFDPADCGGARLFQRDAQVEAVVQPLI